MIKPFKRLSVLAVALLMLFCSAIPAFAECYDKLQDDAILFTLEQEKEIEQKLQNLTKETNWDCIIYTNRNNVSKSRMEDYCNNYYIDHNYGIGSDYDGVFLTIDMSSRELYVITQGQDAMYHFSDTRMDNMLDDIQSCLAGARYYDAAITFMDYISQYHSEGIPSGDSFSNVEIYEENVAKRENPLLYVLTHMGIFIILIAIFVASLSVMFVSLRYKNHGKQNTYNVRDNSRLRLQIRDDVLIDKHISVRTESSSSYGGHRSGSRRSGGSRRSSGGRSHGGGGRSF